MSSYIPDSEVSATIPSVVRSDQDESQERERYRFDDFDLDVQGRKLVKAGVPLSIEPKVFDLLVYLIRQNDRVVPRTQLLHRLWHDTAVCAGALNQCIAVLRRTLGESAAKPRYIRTLPRYGYQFNSAVTRLD